MGICCNSDSITRNKKQRIGFLTIDKSNLKKFKQKYYTEANSSSTAAASSRQNYKPEIYSINKLGIQVKTKQKISQPLKFIFHFYNFKCKMLTENTLYILQIIFDGKEFPLSFGNGNNPTFIFNETIGKEITFEKMTTSFLEVNLYTHKNLLNNDHSLTKGEILAESQIYSCFKINLLTIALAPNRHDLELIDPRRIKVELGRINYFASCYHIEDLYLRISKFKINLNNLKYNEIALNLKFENKNFKREKESQYTDNFIGIPNNKENTMIYEYSNDQNDILLNEGLSEDSTYLISERTSQRKQKYNNDKNEENHNNIDKKTNSNKTFSNNNSNSNKTPNSKNSMNKISDKLYFHGKMSMNDLYNSEFTLNIFSVRLQTDLIEKNTNNENNNKKKPNSDKVIKKEFFMKKLDLPNIAKNCYEKQKNNKQSNFNSNLVNSYELIGVSSLNFKLIFQELEEKLYKISYRLFQSMSNKRNGLVKTLSGSKIMKFGIEQDLTNKVHSNKNLFNINNEIQYRTQNLTLNLFENGNMTFNDEIYWEGEVIGNIEITLEVTNLPLIRQIKFGVMTETGFEVNSIFLYNNLNISDDLPVELLDLIRLKEKFEQEIDFSILKKIKLCLEKTIVDNNLYYGYSSDEDLYQGQAVIIDLGLGLFDLLDKVKFEYFHLIFEILKLITKRSEFDLGTLSARWFKPKRVINKKQSTYCIKKDNEDSIFSFNYDEIAYEFNNKYLLEKHLIEKFLNFHYQILNFCLNNLNKGKNINKESMDFTFFYLSCAFVQIPQFRNSFIKVIHNSINLKNEKYLKFSSHNFLDFSLDESSNTKINNFMLWDSLFYNRLDSSINIYINQINKNNNNNDNNNKKSNFNGLENINAIKEQLMNIKDITEIKEEKEKNTYDFEQKNWYTKLSKRDYIFYDLINTLFNYINDIKNKIYIKTEETNFHNTMHGENISNFVGIRTLLNAISFDLLIKDAKNYPKQIKEIIPQFYSSITTINNFITIMLSTTNVYDTLSIFNLLNILDFLFNKKYDYIDFSQAYIKDNIDYNLFKKSFLIIINSDNSLAIAKFIWFYYKNISLLSYNHIKEIITTILINLFFKLFFHWSFQVREIFYFFIIFILGYKIKKQIKSLKDKDEEKKNEIITHNKLRANISKKMSVNFFANIYDDYKEDKINDLKEIFYVKDYLKEDLDIIVKLQKNIEKEKFDLTYMDNIAQIKDKDILDKIPSEPHGNVIECIKQYNNILTKFNIWEKNIVDNKISEEQIDYPKMEISIIKDDTIHYEYE